MKYAIDHDYHIHSMLSSCSNDPEQSTERILQYAKENGLKKICITDHFWDERVDGASD
ncbi:MAG: PHP domain-containing protein [Clostridia bacterium]|nr:PHP domain-containing protein [Clostridia bacterium]